MNGCLTTFLFGFGLISPILSAFIAYSVTSALRDTLLFKAGLAVLFPAYYLGASQWGNLAFLVNAMIYVLCLAAYTVAAEWVKGQRPIV